MVKDVGPLDWRIPIVTEDGRPTSEFQRRWATQIGNNSEIGIIQTGSGAPSIDPVPGDGEQYLDISSEPYDYYVAYGGTWHQLNDISSLLDTISSTRGSILYRGASAWQALAPGTSGQFLKTNGAGADPSWAAGGSATFKGARVNKTSTQSYNSSGNPQTRVTFQNVQFDTESAWDGTNNIFNVPSGVSYAAVVAGTGGTTDVTGFTELYIRLNGTAVAQYGVDSNWWGTTSIASGPFSVTAGDDIDVAYRASSNITLAGSTQCYMSVIWY